MSFPCSSTSATPQRLWSKGGASSSRSTRRASDCAAAGAGAAAPAMESRVARARGPAVRRRSRFDAGINFGIDQVGEEVDQHEHDAQEQNAALDRGQVALLDGGENVAPHPGPREDGLGEDGPGEVAPEVESEYRDH